MLEFYFSWWFLNERVEVYVLLEPVTQLEPVRASGRDVSDYEVFGCVVMFRALIPPYRPTTYCWCLHRVGEE